MPSCHSNSSGSAPTASQENIYDFTKDTHSTLHVNSDRHFAVFLRKADSVFPCHFKCTTPSNSALGAGRRRGKEEAGLEFGKTLGKLSGLEFEGTPPAKLRITPSSLLPGSPLLPPVLSIFCHSTGTTILRAFAHQVSAVCTVMIRSMECWDSAYLGGGAAWGAV